MVGAHDAVTVQYVMADGSDSSGAIITVFDPAAVSVTGSSFSDNVGTGLAVNGLQAGGVPSPRVCVPVRVGGWASEQASGAYVRGSMGGGGGGGLGSDGKRCR